jgi:hypothetical protein
MSTTDELIRREVDRDAATIRRAVERGGLPTEAEAKEVYGDLLDVLERLEGLTSRVEGIATSDTGADVPFEVSLEHLGVIGMLTSDVEGEIEALASEVRRMRKAMSSLIAIRLEQQFKRVDVDA